MTKTKQKAEMENGNSKRINKKERKWRRKNKDDKDDMKEMDEK